jgi:hypothetical protein
VIVIGFSAYGCYRRCRINGEFCHVNLDSRQVRFCPRFALCPVFPGQSVPGIFSADLDFIVVNHEMRHMLWSNRQRIMSNNGVFQQISAFLKSSNPILILHLEDIQDRVSLTGRLNHASLPSTSHLWETSKKTVVCVGHVIWSNSHTYSPILWDLHTWAITSTSSWRLSWKKPGRKSGCWGAFHGKDVGVFETSRFCVKRIIRKFNRCVPKGENELTSAVNATLNHSLVLFEQEMDWFCGRYLRFLFACVFDTHHFFYGYFTKIWIFR